jgi:hypothetical protein
MNKESIVSKAAILATAAAVVASFCAAPSALGQAPASDASSEHVTVHLSDPSRPGVVKAGLLRGGITVKAYDGKDILIDARNEDGWHGRGEEPPPEPGMHRLVGGATGLTADEENNEVRITTDSVFRKVDLTITVPVHTSLSLHTVTDGDITVSGVDGDIDVNAVSGKITLTGVSGSAVAHCVNGRVVATFSRVNPERALAFSSINGDIDVTLPAGVKADLSLHTARGDVYSDFDVKMQRPLGGPGGDDSGKGDGRYGMSFGGAAHGTINGGGADIQFNNLNGNIYIRKAGATP